MVLIDGRSAVLLAGSYVKLDGIMVRKETVAFLKNLGRNNNREWLQSHKPDFEKAKADFADLITDLIGRTAKFDPRVGGLLAESCVFRIYRDIRFSQDKKPYKTNFGAYISPGGRKSRVPGYYLHLEPGHSFLAAGKHDPDAGELLRIRRAIRDHTEEFLRILRDRKFQKHFGEIGGPKLKTAPKGFPKEHQAIEFLKLKSFIAYVELPDDRFVLSKEFPAFVADAFKETKPLVEFLRRALAG